MPDVNAYSFIFTAGIKRLAAHGKGYHKNCSKQIFFHLYPCKNALNSCKRIRLFITQLFLSPFKQFKSNAPAVSLHHGQVNPAKCKLFKQGCFIVASKIVTGCKARI